MHPFYNSVNDFEAGAHNRKINIPHPRRLANISGVYAFRRLSRPRPPGQPVLTDEPRPPATGKAGRLMTAEEKERVKQR